LTTIRGLSQSPMRLPSRSQGLSQSKSKKCKTQSTTNQVTAL
jgi:hypothetical protein